MAAIDTIVIVVLIFIAGAFIYTKFGEPLSKFWNWLKELMGSGKERFKSNARYTKELVYE